MGVHGSALPDSAYQGLGDKTKVLDRYLEAATATADFFIANSAADGVPYWDTGAPGLVHLGDYLGRASDPFNDHEPVDSSAAAFEVAARQAMLEGCRKAGVKLLEPIMNVEVVTPNDLIGAVTGDITARRGRILNQLPNYNEQTITADVPLAELFGYQRHLHSITDGLAHCTLRFSHYAEVPRRGDGPDDFPPAVGVRA